MTSVPSLKPKEIARIAKRIGFVLDRQKGSHAIYFRETDHQRVVIPMHNKDLKPGTLRGILSDMGVTTDELLKLL